VQSPWEQDGIDSQNDLLAVHNQIGYCITSAQPLQHAQTNEAPDQIDQANVFFRYSEDKIQSIHNRRGIGCKCQ